MLAGFTVLVELLTGEKPNSSFQFWRETEPHSTLYLSTGN
jgi:hypothetical protein